MHLDYDHYILYEGVKVIGYVHIHFLNSIEALILFLFVEKDLYLQKLLDWIEIWLKKEKRILRKSDQ